MSPNLPQAQAPRATGALTFESLGLQVQLLQALRGEGYVEPTPIQCRAIPHVLGGRDLLGCAQTGTGKTAAFALPILQRLLDSRPGTGRRVRALVLSPTRELASQIGESFETYGRHTPLRLTTIFGGVSQRRQVESLRRGSDVVVATPGRLCDLLSQRLVDLSGVETVVLDEADRMLDMGFLPDMRRILACLPAERQTLMFSATMPREIESLAHAILNDAIRVDVAPPATPIVSLAQHVYRVEQPDKVALMVHLLESADISRAIVFTRTKRGANRLSQQLGRASIRAEAIHGNKSQSARTRALSQFKSGQLRILVATDLAARGIDVDGISHVINYDMPIEPETYVHRIGRTARAGASGAALSFCSREEREHLTRIERLIGRRVPVVEEHPFLGARSAHNAHNAPDARPAPARHNPDGLGQFARARRPRTWSASPRSHRG